MSTDADQLIHAYLEGDLTPEQASELSAWVEASDENAERLVRASVQHYLLREQAVGMDLAESAFSAEDVSVGGSDDLAGPDFLQQLSSLADTPQPPPKSAYASALSYVIRHSFTPRRVVMLSTAAALLIGAVVAIVLLNRGPEQGDGFVEVPGEQAPTEQLPPAQRVVATLTAERDAAWDRRPGGDLYAGERFTLTQGVAEIVTAKGAVAILEAPATVELLDNDNALRLHTGKLVGLCQTPASKGFLVRTPGMDITDIGTEFGVEVKSRQTTATVFTGEVEIVTSGGKSQRLIENQTARLSVQDTRPSVILEDVIAAGFDRLLRPAIVTDARINLEGFAVRLVPRGIYEDARLYTDRLHEINGLDESGIPEVLRGGDLVMMPADAKHVHAPANKALELELDLAVPADIYLLWPSSERAADWLQRDYELTRLRAGFDLGEGDINESSGIGPGNSIDAELLIWKRKSVSSGIVTAAYEFEGSMYSVVVVPHRTQP